MASAPDDVRHYRRRSDPVPPSPLTEEQIEWFATAQARAVHKGVRRALAGAFVGYVILFAGTMGVWLNGQHVGNEERSAIVDSGKAVAVDGCNRDFNKFEGIFTRLNAASHEQYMAGVISYQARVKARTFYEGELAALPDCREAEKILTSDPDEQVRIPVPRFPADGG